MRRKLATTLVLVAALVLSTFGVVSSAPRPRRRARAGTSTTTTTPARRDNAILVWNEQLLDTSAAPAGQTGPTVTARALGVLHTATYDAWAAYDAVAKGTRLGSQLRRPADERTLEQGEGDQLRGLQGADRPVPEPPHTQHGAVDLAGQMRSRGYDPDDTTTDTTTPEGIGNMAAKAVLDYRHRDGSNQLGDEPRQLGRDGTPTTPATPPRTSGTACRRWSWQPLCILTPTGVAAGMPATPPDGTALGRLRPPERRHAAVGQGQDVRRSAGLAVPGDRAAQEPERQLLHGRHPAGDQRRRQPRRHKKSKAEYWADGPASVFPPGHDFIFAQALSRKRGHSLDTDVKLFFMLGNAMMDASIASWYQKYKYDYVRPITAIRYHPDFKNKMVNSWLGPNKGFGMVKGRSGCPTRRCTS